MKNLFPLIHHLSRPVSKIIIALPITPNQITTASLIMGIIGCVFFLNPNFEDNILGSISFLIAYIFDNCDGAVARHKNLQTGFGEKYDTFVDWIVHSIFFLALGYGYYQETGNNLWLWLGLFGSIGGTINYWAIFFIESFENESTESDKTKLPKTITENIIFVFRELFRADFCFIILVLAVIDLLWLLLPAGAIGAQIYWIMLFIDRTKINRA